MVSTEVHLAIELLEKEMVSPPGEDEEAENVKVKVEKNREAFQSKIIKCFKLKKLGR